ncbi:MAG TPA: citrate/2-methylcitrate synthase [Candidatus Fusicatenibacter intestinigallinarum]|uniref:Citrate synthase n=1 Tax=Candidatus Fusicatenibacter intestinigallinarum TaxID=2838598 RepID=A0A9D2NBE4_9FIRM|nr:citrate/2-methylcitrate synthase [Candidatus Fusicatenibacter intestinigallinarum]
MSINCENLDKKFDELVEFSKRSGKIDLSLYTEYDVKRGLRDSSGQGVLTGLTEISDVLAFDVDENGEKYPVDGSLYYQGYNVRDLIHGTDARRFGFEEVIYLLLFGELPTQTQLDEFNEILSYYRELPDTFVRDVVMKATSKNMMNTLQKCVLTLYSYDDNPDDISIPNVLRQSLSLIAKLPLIAVYGYHAYRHYHENENLFIRNPKPELSMAENILQMLHPDGAYTELEAKVLDVALILHADHGGGNNSTFTTHVVSSSGTDTYSAIAASLSSLKGPKHGGANLKVMEMFEDIKANVSDWEDEEELRSYLMKMLDKKAFDNSGLIYGMGHAVYTLSDPRCVILKRYAKKLSVEKQEEREFALYERVERIAGDCIARRRRLLKPVCANVDFYSGFVYAMLGLPRELYTPIFAISRIAGWSAHRIEELVNEGKIIRPAYKYVGHHKEYRSVEEREA